MLNLKSKGYKRTYLQNRNTVTDIETNLWLPGVSREGGISWNI